MLEITLNLIQVLFGWQISLGVEDFALSYV